MLAEYWIQFMNGDWINYGDIRFTDVIEVDLPSDDPARARHWQTKMFILAAAMSLSPPSFAQQTVTADPYRAVLQTDLETIAPAKPVTLDIFVTDVTSMAPRPGLAVIASLSMPMMSGMALVPPKVTPGAKPGHYRLQLTFPQAGEYKLDLNVKSAGNRVTLSFPLTASTASAGAKNGMQGPHGTPETPEMQMKASLGDWSANREGSGTSWQPDASPMFMKMLPSFGGFDFSTMGAIQAGYVDAGGKRGDKDPFSVSMIMLMGRRDLGGGTLGLHLMTSLDPFINGRKGVPNLFQNGFTVHGIDISDRKDPHNVFAELALSYSHPLSNDWTGFIYGGPVGDPALGNVMFLHRTSGLEVPEAPISHDWFDGTHISFGVVTLGLVYQDKWKLEGSAFNSAEPGAALYGIGRFKLNSASGRLSYNPSREWSFSTSYGFLKSDVTEYRFTFSAAYSHELPDGDNFSTTAYFGQNIVQGSANSNAWLAEATYYHAGDSFFARFERVDKDELIDVPPGNYTINKLLFGDVHTFFTKDQLDYGVGAYVGVYCFPSSLNPFYGTSPLTFGIFLRIRPSQNRHARGGAEMQHGNP